MRQKLGRQVKPGDMSGKAYGLRLQQGLEANSAPRVQSPAPHGQMQGLDCRTKKWLSQGIGHKQMLDVVIRVEPVTFRAVCSVSHVCGPQPRSEKAKIASCIIEFTYAVRSKVMYIPRTPPTWRRCSLACSSDQKKILSRQKTSTMLGSVSWEKSTSAMKTQGSAPCSSTWHLISLSIAICSG